MEALQILGTALGLTMLAGINLYLTVFVAGLAIRLEWLTNYPQGLEVLADPVVLVISGVFLVVEAIADKVPYVDNAWDAVHTVIRPIGGMLLAIGAAQGLGDLSPTAYVVAALLGGSVTLTAHSAKAGTRLMVNTSPEPVSNIVISTAEDVVVIGGTWLAMRHPILSMVLVIVFLVAFWYSAPKFYRMAKAHAVGIWHRMLARRRGDGGAVEDLPRDLPSFAHETWLMAQHGGEEVVWALPCYSGRMKDIGRNVPGCLVATSKERLFFIGRKRFRTRIRELAIKGSQVLQDPGAVFHRVTLKEANGDTVGLKFTRKQNGYVTKAINWMTGPDRVLKPATKESRESEEPTMVETDR